MKKTCSKVLKTNILNLMVSQGMMNEHDAISMIRQGRIRVNNRIYFDPKHGCSLKAGSSFKIDKYEFYYYPYIYLLYNKPQHIVSSLDSPNSPQSDMNNNIFPICFLNRYPLKLQPLLSLPSNMRGITIYTDDPFLISHVQKNKDSIDNNNKSIFEVQFMHKMDDNMNDDDNESNLHYTDWNILNSKELTNKLYDGIDIHATKNKERFKNVNIENIQLIDDNFKNDNINYNDIRISKWRITMCKYPKSLYRLLRSVNLSPYYIDRISIGHIDINHDIKHINDWRIMHEKEIQSLANYNNPKSTKIDKSCLMKSKKYKNINKLIEMRN